MFFFPVASLFFVRDLNPDYLHLSSVLSEKTFSSFCTGTSLTTLRGKQGCTPVSRMNGPESLLLITLSLFKTQPTPGF